MGVRRTETALIVWSGRDRGPQGAGTTQAADVSRPAVRPADSAAPVFGADQYFDAGDKGCGDGPLDRIAALVRALQPGQTLEIHATDPSVAVDLASWCRMTGHQLVEQRTDRYLVQKKIV